jgi:hypothetical protein
MDKIKTIAALGLGILLFSSFRKKGTPISTSSRGYIIPSNLPTGVKLVYSKVGTILFDKNGNTVLTYDQAGLGMTVTGFDNGVYSIVYGDTFYNGQPAYVKADDVITA